MTKLVKTSLGQKKVDSLGSPVAIVRIEPGKAYGAIPGLLQKVIDGNDTSAWNDITTRIDYICDSLNNLFTPLDQETGFTKEIKKRVNSGQRLFIKPNLVSPTNIDPITHASIGPAVTTPWPTIAALMRWFHDNLGITYNQMSLGEAPTTLSVTAGRFSLIAGRKITTQAVIEGKDRDFYGGWGFYFVRRYLVKRHQIDHRDDPMNGYEESLAGLCLPPGKEPDKLLVYDINKIDDDRANGRDCIVPHGVNYHSITLHKAVVGGNPSDKKDRSLWPGCVLINVPRLKMHVTEMLTAAVKNVGIGLYPMEVNISPEPGKVRWKYAVPHKTAPGMKSLLPHRIWTNNWDDDTALPETDGDGKPILTRTGGMPSTMADIIEAVMMQDIYMFHVLDAIEATNGLQAGPAAVPVPEGLLLASIDPLAVDTAASHYVFKNVLMAEARRIKEKNHSETDFLQKVPLPVVEGKNIVTKEGYDSPVPRYKAFPYCEERGIGNMQYHVIGKDLTDGGELASVEGHLGRVCGDTFSEILPTAFYTSIAKPLYDMQVTAFAYAEANDKITGSAFKSNLLVDFDENGDGIIDYNEKGKTCYPNLIDHISRLGICNFTEGELLRINFLMAAIGLRYLINSRIRDGIKPGSKADMNASVSLGLQLSRMPSEQVDPFYPEMTYGLGKWPSIQYTYWLWQMQRIYGPMFPYGFDSLMAPYGLAVRYAALRWGANGFKSTSGNLVEEYHQYLADGNQPFSFTIYVPVGFGHNNKIPIPNVVETDDLNLIYVASFGKNDEIWNDLSLSSIP